MKFEQLTVAMIMVHFCEHVDSVRVESKVRRVDNTQSVQLMPQSALPEDELGRIRPIETIDAVRAAYAVLHGHRGSP